MRIIHRHLFAELLRNTLLTAVAILAIFFMVALALVLGTRRAAGVPFSVIVEHTFYEAVSTLGLTVPLTVLTASIFTYGRSRADREFTAMRVAGIAPHQVLLPGLILGAAATFGLGCLSNEVMPGANFKSRIEIDQDVLRHLDALLKRGERSIVEENWIASWRDIHESEGRLALDEFRLVLTDDEGRITETLEARTARPELDVRTLRLFLELEDVLRRPSSGPPLQAGAITWTLDLENVGKAFKGKRSSDRSMEELLTHAARAGERAARAETQRRRERIDRKRREAVAEYHQRVAQAFSAFVFAFLGAVIGLRYGTKNRAVVFLVGFVIVAGLFYPLTMLGHAMAVKEILPAALALWLGNAALAFGGLVVLRGLLRP